MRVDGHQGGGAFGQQVMAYVRVELKTKDDGLGADLLDAGLDPQDVPIGAGSPEAAPGLDDEQAKAFTGAFEGILGGQAQGPQVLLDGPVAIAEVTDKIDDAARVGVPEAHLHPGVMDPFFFRAAAGVVDIMGPPSSMVLSFGRTSRISLAMGPGPYTHQGRRS
jgi:hypothetical protein